MPEGETRTRRELDAALRALLNEKPLARIRVRELTERCGLRRQSFYYHFKDVYDLFDWCVERERGVLRARRGECVTWEQVLRDLWGRTAEHGAFYCAVAEQRGRRGLGDLLELREPLGQAYTYYRNRCGAPPDPAAEEMRLGWGEAVLLSLLEDRVRGDLDLEPETMLQMLEKVVRQSVAGATAQTLRRQREEEPWGEL